MSAADMASMCSPHCIPCPPGLNGTNMSDILGFNCARQVPTAQDLFATMKTLDYVAFSFLVLFTVITLAIYAEEIYFIIVNFNNESRQQMTLWVLAVYPVYSCCSLLGACVPRCSPMVQMVASGFFATCIYNFSKLMMNYLGGPQRAKTVVADGRPMKLNTPPCCCCCVCLPTIRIKPRVLNRITFFVLQIVVVRPVMMFIAAILWANGNFVYGTLEPYPMYPLVSIINVISMMIAVYGLMLFQRIFRHELEKPFKITGKIASIQLVMIVCAIPNLITSGLVAARVIRCTYLFPGPTRGEEICNGIIVLLMVPLSIVGRIFYRRQADAWDNDDKTMANCAPTAATFATTPIVDRAIDNNNLLPDDGGLNRLTYLSAANDRSSSVQNWTQSDVSVEFATGQSRPRSRRAKKSPQLSHSDASYMNHPPPRYSSNSSKSKSATLNSAGGESHAMLLSEDTAASAAAAAATVHDDVINAENDSSDDDDEATESSTDAILSGNESISMAVVSNGRLTFSDDDVIPTAAAAAAAAAAENGRKHTPV